MMATRYVSSRVEAYMTMMSPIKLKNVKQKVVYLKATDDEINQACASDRFKKISCINMLKILSGEQNRKMEKNELLNLSEGTINNLKRLETEGFVEMIDEEYRETVNFEKEDEEKTERSVPPKLSEEQENALGAISTLVKKGGFSEFLLHGITGSGKTEIYLALLDIINKRGDGAILLVPEIALTAQMIQRVKARFGNDVCVLHSRITPNEKTKAHALLRSGKVRLAIGVRSAVFAPVQKLQLIIVDEEQEPSYKSFETRPYYNAAEVAAMRMKQRGGVVVYGSATPRVSTYYRALKREIGYAYMGKRATESELPEAKIVDMKNETAGGNYSPISRTLYSALKENYEKKEQSIIFVPRRGYSAKLICLACGKTLMCPHCRVAVSYHKNANRVICHYCGTTSIKPEKCPSCGSTNMTPKTYGTEMIANELDKLFPGAGVIRMDTDTTKSRLGHKELLEKFEKENVPFLVGTQMVAKGLDFPNVTLAGVVGADSLTSVQEYNANERAFVLLTQVFGRAGRAKEKKGVGIVQTYSPSEKVFANAIAQDYIAFYKDEINFRETLGYPPFAGIATVTGSSLDDRYAFDVMSGLCGKMKSLAEKDNEIDVMNVARSALPKLNDRYRWEFMIKSKNKNLLIKIMNEFREKTLMPLGQKEQKKGKNKVLVNVDVDFG